ncbi:glycosyltransferase [Pseudomonas sp. CCC3.2]|uniref:glycosyltransferase n=1 Tax=unclassified Pseudomonas TaxID=196821 RepID=UPI002AB47CCA|nr:MULTISPECIES: glycosyltransferase [unclassified Pseudomonas]MDY7561398.1 glycosyltransferase [Pseudomonas sp. AB6]MEB0178930.1 glycosyltransferase [Pseudomonas sp. CCC3.2]MEB0210194.1 glycosyltransferase [Pseudomonas sp. AB6]
MNKVSVMMPAYNAELFIAEALTSILNQNYTNIQIVVCDDASQDKTAAIIADYAERYPEKIKAILNKKNLGVTANCNLALMHCDGEFISLFAGDDLMLPGKIAKQVAVLENDLEISLCYHPVEIFDSETNEILFVTNQTSREDVLNFEDMLLKGGIPGGCSIMVRRSAIPLGGYDSRLKTVSDWLFFLEISLMGKVVKINEVLARYRKHMGGASQNSYSLLEESLYALDILLLKHPYLESKITIFDKAKARYLAGETFRQLASNGSHAHTLSQRLLKYDHSVKYKILYFFVWMNSIFPIVSPMISYMAKKTKFFLKRMVG